MLAYRICLESEKSWQPGQWSQPQKAAMWLSTGLALITLYNGNKTPTYPCLSFFLLVPLNPIAEWLSPDSSSYLKSYSLKHQRKNQWSQIQKFQRKDLVAQPRSSAHSYGRRDVTCGQGQDSQETANSLGDHVNGIRSSFQKRSTVLSEISKFTRQINQLVSNHQVCVLLYLYLIEYIF